MRDIIELKNYYNRLGRLYRLFFPSELANALNRNDVAPITVFKLANTAQLRLLALIDPHFNFFDRPRVKLWSLFQKRGLLESGGTLTNFDKIANMAHPQYLISTTHALNLAGLLTNFTLSWLVSQQNQKAIFNIVAAMHNGGLFTGEKRRANLHSFISHAPILMHPDMCVVWQNIPRHACPTMLSQYRWETLINMCELSEAHPMQQIQQMISFINPFFAHWYTLPRPVSVNHPLPLTVDASDDETELDQLAPVVLNNRRPTPHYRMRFFEDRRIGFVEIPNNFNEQTLSLTI